MVQTPSTLKNIIRTIINKNPLSTSYFDKSLFPEKYPASLYPWQQNEVRSCCGLAAKRQRRLDKFLRKKLLLRVVEFPTNLNQIIR
jgi:hypothetical protein